MQILSKALIRLKELISSVDQEVLELGQSRRLQEIQARLDPRAQAEARGGGVFRGGELLRRRLLHEGTLHWKVQGSRMKGGGGGGRRAGLIMTVMSHLCGWSLHLLTASLCLSPEVQVLLMSDILVFLQEKDQKFSFASLVSHMNHA